MKTLRQSLVVCLATIMLHKLEHVNSLAFSNKGTSINTSTSTSTTTNRRNALKNFITRGSTAAALTLIVLHPDQAGALEACRPKSRNCIRTTWSAPQSVTQADAVESIRTVLNSYPQKGQNGIDCKGWTLTNDSLDGRSSTGTARLEYKSCVGPAALSINLGQPFIDDVKLEMNVNEVDSTSRVSVDVKSSSRMGGSDFFVNQKRIEYLGNELQKLGWDIPNVRYGS